MKRTLKRLIRATGLQRQHVAAARMYGERYFIALTNAALALTSSARSDPIRSTGRILCYHSIGQPTTGVNDVRPKLFCRQIELALRSGFRFVPAAQIALGGGCSSDLAITFDDGWTSAMSVAAPILRNYHIPWSLFIVSDWSDHRADWAKEVILSWRDIDHLMATGVQIGSHSATHPDFGLIERTQMIDELYGSREAIRRHLGVAPTSFAIPYGQSMNWPPMAAELAREAGYQVVYAQAEDTRPPGTAPRTFVTRFDDRRIFNALLEGAYDHWEEWV
jgi:peptidoglycan/xylan/chitin deacetylase (PgdA/CDA1 family)